ncbi:right-handed parallel beta-helix repeat-containing protein [Chitinophaga tropicalis]|uniref:Right-handed parallel beta-helix repeat-containing protein n=1 Tax=Chitinophaga tropicalis TaxID=2683588 RepID=A0A7K1U453_9BACT|nr:right-handed parallel beta-helix repeat-containing protein [Chitinophaga tropicalis]MVT09119.1 right-handed parallel beta-helix repeat-containing protein [Chitinophaga tropicalis]
MIAIPLLFLAINFIHDETLAQRENYSSGIHTAASPVSGREFTLVPDVYGRLTIDNADKTYKPGDILNLKGNFKSVYISNLSGSASAPIIIQNAKNTVVTIGVPSWNGGGYSSGCSFWNCHYIRFGGRKDMDQVVINGSTQAAREAYRDLQLESKSDNMEICNLTINNGGNGIVAKTDPVKGDATTLYPNTVMQNLLIHDLIINGTKNEAMYIGHTATYWDFTANIPYYGPPSGFTPGHQYVQPILWRNVRIYNNIVKNIGLDGIQTAATDGLEISNNEISNWAMQRNSSHNGGIVIGGRTTNTNTHDNYVHDGYGEFCQFYGSGENGATHIINNNLFRDNQSNGISLRGTANAIVRITNNTIAGTKENSLRINGYTGMTGKQIVQSNAFIAPYFGNSGMQSRCFIYVEVNGAVTEGTGEQENKKFYTVNSAGVNPSNYYLPLSGSPMGRAGYRRPAPAAQASTQSSRASLEE